MSDLLARAIGWRAGTGVAAGPLPRGLADPDLPQWSASEHPGEGGSPCGGAGWTDDDARRAAIGELLERAGAGVNPLPTLPRAAIPPAERVIGLDDFHVHSRTQRAAPGFPFAAACAEDRFVRFFDLADNTPVWVPATLVELGHSGPGLATSSGLAAGPGSLPALLRAVQELVERDALMTTWLFGVAARRVRPPALVAELAGPLHADVTVLDLTPAYSPHPVAAVAGTAPSRGRHRAGVGVACRSSWEKAVEKALLEWAQAVTFAGITTAGDPPGLRPEPDSVTSFDEHARYYTRRPDAWAALPWWTGPDASPPPDAPSGTDAEQLATLVPQLRQRGIRLFYRDLTVVDTAACGVRVARVVSPDVSLIHGDDNWPFLALEPDRAARLYPGLPVRTRFPSPFPHPLG
ncbi:MAG: YcaO-like family protein [Propionicimonas sp.]|uniref:YcaO-like family protein n=1 Tax=Propionicimonas sp. TaxID=1955623 RepID=UPI003D0E49D4